MTQEQLAYIVDRAPRTIMYNENDGQHPSLNTFYQMVTMFDISVDQYFYPSKNKGSECRKRIDAILNALDEKELKIVEAMIQAMKILLAFNLRVKFKAVQIFRKVDDVRHAGGMRPHMERGLEFFNLALGELRKQAAAIVLALTPL